MVKPLQLFYTYLKIGTFTLGGGYAMLPLIQREVVDRRHWLEEKEFLDMIAIAQAVPGLIAVNSAIFLGWKLAGWRGVLSSVLGAVLPSFLIILAIAILFSRYTTTPTMESVFRGVRPAVVALIAAPLWRMARAAEITWLTAFIPIAALLLIWWLGLSPVWVILLAICITLLYTLIKENKHP